MQASLEQAIEIIRALPVEDYGKLREVLDEEEKAKREKDEKSQWRLERYKRARKWLDENGEKYMNEGVCLEGDELIAHSVNGREVFQKARELGIESPFLHHIVEEPKFFFGGGYEAIRD